MGKGLYREEFEKDACGIGFIAQIQNISSHKIVKDALKMLHRMEHRGGVAADDKTGDGAGILTQIPHDYLKQSALKDGVKLPKAGNYGIGMAFFPKRDKRSFCDSVLKEAISELGLTCVWVRKVDTMANELGEFAKSNEPNIYQYFIIGDGLSESALNRKLYLLRKLTEFKAKGANHANEFYMASCSTKTITYKGELRTWQLDEYYPDLKNPEFSSSFAIVHSRFSTNTLPEWRLAQPFRFIAHNGEINTIKGNVNKMLSREALFHSTYFTEDEIDILLPICLAELSDSANLDLAVELLVMGGRSLDRVMAMLVPPAWRENDELTDELKAFYAYHATFLEPWDGPAALCFTDGNQIGACIDRNGLRPTRYAVTDDGRLIFASETGIVNLDPANVIKRGKLKPGQMLLVNLIESTIEEDVQIKERLSKEYPYARWNKDLIIPIESIESIASDEAWKVHEPEALLPKQLSNGYSKEDLKFILTPLSQNGTEPIGSMGNDSPLAVFAKRGAHISNYFKQLFAQVSNPPMDPIREKSVMSLAVYLGQSNNLLEDADPTSRKIALDQPIILPKQVEALKTHSAANFKGGELRTVYDPSQCDLERAIKDVTASAERLVKEGVNLLILSNKIVDDEVAIPSLLITGSVHNQLINSGLRSRVSLIVEAGDVIETHHFATLIGYGASAVCPYLAFDTILSTTKQPIDLAIQNYIKGINYGLRKILSKMGISTLQSYESAQIFESLGLSDEVVNQCFKGTVNTISGKTFAELEQDLLMNYELIHDKKGLSEGLVSGGIYQWRVEGEEHLFNPKTIHLLQKSTRLNDYSLFKEYSEAIDDQEEKNITLRSLFSFVKTSSIPIEEVEPASEIMKRFATGAMSFGSISEEAHTLIAKAMNFIGGKSNSGEGGEDSARFVIGNDGLLARSAIKQVASGRFGVTTDYLINADELQIKMAQGAKPGEGGQLPGLKVDENIARIRNSTPGVTLISPPPHHDIYSIEDLAQLIFDLKNVNSSAEVNVKLVSEAGVGTIAAGVAKANADNILISGHDGGTGASPLSSVQHAGVPWEIGLAEAHQTLMRNGLRNRIKLQTDGQIKTAKDLAIATILGAEEWGVATAVLVVQGCVMMRKCHLNTCPVGIATQNPALRKLFTGEVEHIVSFFKFLAEGLRELMAELGVKTINELVGRTDLLYFDKTKASDRVGSLDLSPLLENPWANDDLLQCKTTNQRDRLKDVLDHELISLTQPTFKHGERVRFGLAINNENRSTGAMLSGVFTKAYGPDGLPDGTVTVDFNGTAGQSFGAFLSHGITLNLEGEANDYVGKGLSGGKIVIYPSPLSTYRAAENILIGNVALYGATRGRLYVNGQAGERFAVRNSGVQAVIEGIGDHGCEYMTGGRVVILGETGHNFAAGMSGGVAYVFARDFGFAKRCNMELVQLEHPGEDDFDMLRIMLDKHQRYTNSVKAFEILSNWTVTKNHFVKVIPIEYKKVMMQKRNFKKVIR